MSHLKPGIGYLRFISWAFSFLAAKIRRSCITTIGVLKAAGETLKDQLLKVKDYNVIEIESDLGTKIDDVISVLKYPEVNKDIWEMIEAVFAQFEKATALDDLMYGQTSHQYRSAAEAQVKQNAARLRPDDMANKTEDWLSRIAAKEAMAWRWLGEGKDVEPVVGQAGAQAWAQLVQSSSIESVVREFDYRVEAGSARKPNREGKIDAMNQAVQSWGNVFNGWAEKTGDVAPLNGLIQAWADANEIPMPNLDPPPQPIQQGPEPTPPQQGDTHVHSHTHLPGGGKE